MRSARHRTDTGPSRALTPEQLQDLAARGERRGVTEGEVLHQEGEPFREFLAILKAEGRDRPRPRRARRAHGGGARTRQIPGGTRAPGRPGGVRHRRGARSRRDPGRTGGAATRPGRPRPRPRRPDSPRLPVPQISAHRARRRFPEILGSRYSTPDTAARLR
ncbi:hypothetical protein ACU686_10130 [Yinghuangia aomiensis]